MEKFGYTAREDRETNQVGHVWRRVTGSGTGETTGATQQQPHKRPYPRAMLQGKSTLPYTSRVPRKLSTPLSIRKNLCKSGQQDLLKPVAQRNTVKGTEVIGQTPKALLNGSGPGLSIWHRWFKELHGPESVCRTASLQNVWLEGHGSQGPGEQKWFIK